MVSEPTINITVGTRIDVSGDKATVKYVGKVANTQGEWLGVDWDDPERGKHDGIYMGVQYFKARYPTSGSFIRPGKANVGVSIVQAIMERYGLVDDLNVGIDVQSIAQVQKEIKAKFFEIVGAEKLNKKQSDFNSLHVVLLQDTPINGAGPPLALFRLCPNITELDISKSLLTNWGSVAEITRQLKKLKILNLSDNQLEFVENVDPESFSSLEHIVLGRINYTWEEVLKCSEFFLNIQILQIPFNRIEILKPPPDKIFTRLTWLDLEGNRIRSWDEINKLGRVKSLELLNLTNCGIEKIHIPCSETCSTSSDLFENLQNLILNENKIADWFYICELDKLKSLTELKFRENPVLTKENLDTNRQLVIVRINNLKILNGLEITPEERRGAEIDYLKRFGLEWLAIKTEEERNNFRIVHPCYQRLVEKYGAPDANELKKPPTSLKSQLIQIEIVSPDRQLKSYSKKIPYNMSVQKLAGLIQRLFNTGYEIPKLTCLHAERNDNMEVPLDNNMKDLNYYSVENGDKILVRW